MGLGGCREYRGQAGGQPEWVQATDSASLILCSSGASRGILSFKGCTTALSHSPQVSYLASPPGVSIASYSHICRSYLCNNLTNLEPFVKFKASQTKSIALSSKKCPTCLGKHDADCLPSFVTNEACPYLASSCFSSTFTFQAGESTVWDPVSVCLRDCWDPEVGMGVQEGHMNSRSDQVTFLATRSLVGE